MVRRTPWIQRPTLAFAVAGSLAVGVLTGALPAQAGSGYGILVSATVTPRTWLSGPATAEYRLVFRAQAGMTPSDVGVRRVGDSIVVFEEEGGPSLGVADGTYCKSSNPSGPSSEVTCTFPGALPNSDWVATADFSDAPIGAFFVIEQGSSVRAEFTGSPYDDYFQGGDLNDAASGGEGGDNIYGGGGSDALWGGGGDDDMEGGAGSDRIRGGPGADNIDGEGDGVENPGDPDSIIGGTGADDIVARDEATDFVDCGDPAARVAGVPEKGNTVEYDAKLDKPIDCGTVEVPSALTPPTISTTSPKAGETITGTLGTWRGTAPITYGYSFERCPFDLTEFRPCTTLKSGSLDAKGLDGGKPPAYTVAKADQRFTIKYSVSASNTSKQGGGPGYASVSTLPVAAPATFAVPSAWAPRQQGSTWSFAKASDVQAAIESSAVGPFTDVILIPIARSKVAKNQQKAVKDGSVVEVKVNSSVLTPGAKVVVEADADQRARISLRYYSVLEDRRTCPVSDSDIASLNQAVTGGQVSLAAILRYLEGAGSTPCPYVVEWDESVSSQNVFRATSVALEESDDADRPVQVRVKASEPSLRAGLSMLIGAPPEEYVKQRPEDFSLDAQGRLTVFPNSASSAIWVGLVGDQARESAKFAVVDLYVNGRRVLQESFRASTGSSTPFSTVLTYAFTEPGTARIVISTLMDAPGNPQVESQVFMDLPIVRADTTSNFNLVTWDGRCFTTAGVPGDCAFLIPGQIASMKAAVDKSIGFALGPITDDRAALRYASAKLDKRFVAIGVNSTLDLSSTGRSARYRQCWLIDVPCHIGNAIEAGVQALTRPKSVPGKPKPPKVRNVLRVKVLPLSSAASAGGVVGEGILKVPGVGLINLDGSTLINLDGSTFTRELAEAIKAGLINLDGSTLINLDGSTLINLDGSTLVGIDPSTLINLDGSTLISDMGGAFSPLAMFSLERIG